MKTLEQAAVALHKTAARLAANFAISPVQRKLLADEIVGVAQQYAVEIETAVREECRQSVIEEQT